jgi:hypothetical protein
MPRETTKHGPRAGDQLAAEAARGDEPGGPTRLDEPLGDASLPGEQPLRYIGADHRGALAAHLRALPADLTFDGAASVATAFGAVHSDR